MSAFIDTNVPMYAAGSPHVLKQPCIAIGLLAAEYPDSFVTDAEVLQEILHRYMAQRSLPQGLVVLQEFEELMRGRIAPLQSEDVLMASTLGTDSGALLSARDLIHLAVMRRLGVSRIISADRSFDTVSDLERLDPARIDDWREAVAGS